MVSIGFYWMFVIAVVVPKLRIVPKLLKSILYNCKHVLDVFLGPATDLLINLTFSVKITAWSKYSFTVLSAAPQQTK